MAKKFISYALLTKYDGLLKAWVNGLINEANGDITTLEGLVNTLIGSDNGKSARTIANEEMAAVLLVDPETGEKNFKTLQALAQYLEDHPEEVADILASIKAIDDKVGKLPTGDDAPATVVAYIAKVAADLATEAATARAAEALNASNITAEAQRAQDAEEALDEKIGHNAAAIGTATEKGEDGTVTKAGTGLTKRIEDLEAKNAAEDFTVEDTAVDGQYVSSVAQGANGKITVSRVEIPVKGVDEDTSDYLSLDTTNNDNILKVHVDDLSAGGISIVEDESGIREVSNTFDEDELTGLAKSADVISVVKDFAYTVAEEVNGIYTKIFDNVQGDTESTIKDLEDATTTAFNEQNDRLDTILGEGEGSIKKAVADLNNTAVSSTSGEDVKVTLGGTVGAPTVSVSLDFATEQDIEDLFKGESTEG